MNSHLKIVFFGTPQFVVPILEVLNQKYDVVAVVTAPDKKVGRKQLLTPSPVKQFATRHNIPALTPENLSPLTSHLSPLNPHLFVVAAYGRIIPQEILNLPTYGALNIHPSPLPKYRGPSPITQTLLNGDKTTAISFIKLDEQMDHGPILQTITYEVPDDATTETLTHYMFQKSAELLPEVINDYVTEKVKPTPQNHDEATYTHIITKQDGYIDLDKPPAKEKLDRMIRAYFPWPGVWGKLKTKNGELKIVKLLPSYICHSREHGNPEDTNNSFENTFCLQLEGGKPMSIKDFLNGYPEMKETIKKVL